MNHRSAIGSDSRDGGKGIRALWYCHRARPPNSRYNFYRPSEFARKPARNRFHRPWTLVGADAAGIFSRTTPNVCLWNDRRGWLKTKRQSSHSWVANFLGNDEKKMLRNVFCLYNSLWNVALENTMIKRIVFSTIPIGPRGNVYIDGFWRYIFNWLNYNYSCHHDFLSPRRDYQM